MTRRDRWGLPVSDCWRIDHDPTLEALLTELRELLTVESKAELGAERRRVSRRRR